MNLTCFEYIGITPVEEEPAALGCHPSYALANAIELAAYRDQLARQHPLPIDARAELRIGYSEHEFGRYGEVQLWFNPNDAQALAYSETLDRHAPSHWDDRALVVRTHLAIQVARLERSTFNVEASWVLNPRNLPSLELTMADLNKLHRKTPVWARVAELLHPNPIRKHAA